jgi:hypothetical protein
MGMESKKQTAVDWFNQEVLDLQIKLENNEISNFDFLKAYKTTFNQAKEMEKQQIIEARVKPLKMFMELRNKHGYFGGHDNGAVIEREINESEQYYNETFKTE